MYVVHAAHTCQHVYMTGANVVVMNTHTHTNTILQSSWILSGITWVSRHQKGKTNLDLLQQKIVSGSGIKINNIIIINHSLSSLGLVTHRTIHVPEETNSIKY